MNSKIFDLTVWENWKSFELEEESPGFLMKLLSDAIESTEPHWKKLKAAIEGRDLEATFFHAHTLGSTCLSVGAVKLGNLLREMEFAAHAKPPRLRHDLLPALETAFNEFMIEARKERDRMKSAA